MIKKRIMAIVLCVAFLCFPQTIAAQEQRNIFLDVNNNKVDENIENKIQKWTYQPETGVLNIYLADQEVTTLTAQSKLYLGTLSVRASNLENVKITVDENALQYVNKENLLTQDEKTVSSTVTLGKKDDSQENGDNANGNHGGNTDEDSLDSQGDDHLNDADKGDGEDTKKPVKEDIQTGRVVPIALYTATVLATLIAGAILIVLKKKEELTRR